MAGTEDVFEVLRLDTEANSSTIGIETHFTDAQLERPLACLLPLSHSEPVRELCPVLLSCSSDFWFGSFCI